MLMRRRVVKAAEPAQEQRDEVEYLRVEVATTGEVIEIPIPKITRGEADSLKDELNELLYCEAVEEEAEDEADEAKDEEDEEDDDAEDGAAMQWDWEDFWWAGQ